MTATVGLHVRFPEEDFESFKRNVIDKMGPRAQNSAIVAACKTYEAILRARETHDIDVVAACAAFDRIIRTDEELRGLAQQLAQGLFSEEEFVKQAIAAVRHAITPAQP